MASGAPAAAITSASASPLQHPTTSIGGGGSSAPAIDTEIAPAPTPTTAATTSTPAHSQSRGTSETNGQSSFQTQSDGRHLNGQDNRVRNPVPSKLKGKTDEKNGNFSVMQIDLTRPDMTERDAAAKRTSEGTAAAAKQASMEGYRPIKRSKLAWPPRDGDGDASAQSLMNGSGKLPRGLNPQETKREQARLLTLLRSLRPVLVVDQVCKALAYFGGIPGALPPADGVFPESATTNGPGSLFIGWLAEIFPHLENGIQPGAEALPPVGDPAATTDTSTQPVKRSRGRPKGSKTKFRRDKDGTKMSIAAGDGPGAEGDASGLQLITGSGGSQPTNVMPGDASSSGQISSVAQTAAADRPDPNSSLISTPGSKKRGRPKGSKNRPKPAPLAQNNGVDSTNTAPATQTPNMSTESPLANKSMAAQSRAVGDHNVSRGASGGLQHTPSISHPAAGMQSMPAGQGIDSAAVTIPESNLADQTMQASQQLQHGSQDAPAKTGPHRKRKAPRQAQDGRQESASGPTADMGSVVEQSEPNTGNVISPQVAQAKRRRVSKETGQQPAFSGMDSLSSRPDLSASPAISAGASETVALPASASSSFSSPVQNNRIPNFRNNSNPRAQQQQQQQQNLQPQQLQQSQQGQAQFQRPATNFQQLQKQQQQNHNLNQQFQQQQSPNMGPQRPNHTPTHSRQRNQLTGQQSTNRTQQSYYQQQHNQQQQQQRQMMSQFGQAGNANFARTMGSNSPAQFQHQSLASTPVQQGPFSQPPPPTPSPSSSLDNNASHQSPSFNPRPQPPPPSQQQQPTATMGPFSAYTPDHHGSYLDMDYSGSPAAAAAAAAAAFNGNTQLEAALAEPNMRERIYHAIGRR